MSYAYGFHSKIFSLFYFQSISLYLKCMYYKTAYNWLLLFYYSANPLPLNEIFSSFTISADFQKDVIKTSESI